MIKLRAKWAKEHGPEFVKIVKKKKRGIEMKDKAFKVIEYIVVFITLPGLLGGLALCAYIIKVFPMPENFFGRIAVLPIIIISVVVCFISYYWLLRRICKTFKPFDEWYEKKTGRKMDISTFLDMK